MKTLFTIIVLALLACTSNPPAQVNIEQTDPLTVGVTYAFTHYGDTVAIEQAEIIDPNRGIIFTDEWKILVYYGNYKPGVE